MDEKIIEYLQLNSISIVPYYIRYLNKIKGIQNKRGINIRSNLTRPSIIQDPRSAPNQFLSPAKIPVFIVLYQKEVQYCIPVQQTMKHAIYYPNNGPTFYQKDQHKLKHYVMKIFKGQIKSRTAGHSIRFYYFNLLLALLLVELYISKLLLLLFMHSCSKARHFIDT